MAGNSKFQRQSALHNNNGQDADVNTYCEPITQMTPPDVENVPYRIL